MSPSPHVDSEAVADTSISLCATPKQRKAPHCRSCGSPMRGHKLRQCTPAAGASPVTGVRPRKKAAIDAIQVGNAEDLAQVLKELSLQRKPSAGGDTSDPLTPLTSKPMPLAEERSPSPNQSQVPKDETPSTAAFEIESEDLKPFVGSWVTNGLMGVGSVAGTGVVSPADTTEKGGSKTDEGGTLREDGIEVLLRFVQENSQGPAVNLYAFPSARVVELEAKAREYNVPVRIIDSAPPTRSRKRRMPEGSYVYVLVGGEGQMIDGTSKEVEGVSTGRPLFSGTALGSGAAVGAVVTWMYLAFS